ncbi:RIIa domain-containing protein 1 isoform X1 [Lepus europaeus]|uniref:RIIa domain-containing protein 1 isoform X1 n=1 Tax=Lepus europaeus TaxID=9983 RepID=UPI002B49779C|nr:RIIa domain-containing protein 1 isoform X1 [Lepus europaeus]
MATLPSGLLGPEPGLLSPEQLEKLRVFKIETRIANEKYLRAHKEVEFLISGFLSIRKTSLLYSVPLRDCSTLTYAFPLSLELRTRVCPGIQGPA